MIEETIATAVIIGCVQAIKMAGLPSKFAPAVSILLGLIYAVTISPSVDGAFTGLVIGLTASGLYSGTRATIK